MPTPENLRRLGEAARKRRTDMKQTQDEIARAGGLSPSSQTRLETGNVKRVSSATLDKIDDSLEWEPGSARAILDGGEPTPLPGTRYEPPSRRHSSVLDAIMADPLLQAGDKAALYDQYIRVLASYGPSAAAAAAAASDDTPDDENGGSRMAS